MMQRINNLISPTRAGRLLLAIQVILSGCLACKRSPESVRATFAGCFTKPDGLERLREYAKERKDPDELAELTALLYTFALPLNRLGLADRLSKENVGRGKSDFSKAVFSEMADDRIRFYQGVIQERPHDFLPKARYAWAVIVSRGGSSNGVDQAIQQVEQLTNYHPICLRLRGAQHRIVTIREPNYLQQTKKCYPFFKLHDFALRLIDKNFVESDETREVYAYLKKKGITPPEPTAAQYAAVKKRGWAFNKQMLEPFRRVP